MMAGPRDECALSDFRGRLCKWTRSFLPAGPSPSLLLLEQECVAGGGFCCTSRELLLVKLCFGAVGVPLETRLIDCVEVQGRRFFVRRPIAVLMFLRRSFLRLESFDRVLRLDRWTSLGGTAVGGVYVTCGICSCSIGGGGVCVTGLAVEWGTSICLRTRTGSADCRCAEEIGLERGVCSGVLLFSREERSNFLGNDSFLVSHVVDLGTQI